MIRHYHHTRLRLLFTLMALCFGAGASSASPSATPSVVVAILPLANHARDVHAPDTVNPILRRLLTASSLIVREADATRAVLRRHRIRAIGVIDRSGARALVDDLGVDYLITGAIDRFATGRFPEVVLSLRLVDAHTLHVIWAHTVGATGDDFTTVFGLGGISSIGALIERFLPDAIREIERAARHGAPKPPSRHDVTFDMVIVAADSLTADSQWVRITVSEMANDPPVIQLVGNQTTREERPLAFTVHAHDPEGSRVAISLENHPNDASWTDHGNDSATFVWTPARGDAGSDTVLIIATDGVSSDSERVVIAVARARNHPPHLSRLRARTITENVGLVYEVSAIDRDGTVPQLRAKTLPVGATFDDRGDGTGILHWTPGFTDAGVHHLRFVASDGYWAHTNVLPITVIDAGNQPPQVTPFGDLIVTEHQTLRTSILATDPDRTTPRLTATDLPNGASFVDCGDGTGLIEWTPGHDAAGEYALIIVASDGALSESLATVITVGRADNRAPTFAPITRQRAVERQEHSIILSAIDPEGGTPVLTATNLPNGASFTDLGNGCGSLDWTPGFDAAGVYEITITASDGILESSTVVTLVIDEIGNQPPVLDSVGTQSVTESELLRFAVSAGDSDATVPTLSIDGVPETAVFTDHGDGTGLFEWTPSFTESGNYELIVIAADETVADSERVILTVADAGNQPPIIAEVGLLSIHEETPWDFRVTASDPDTTIPTLTAGPLPRGARFTDNGDGTALFEWTPGAIDDLACQRIAVIGFDDLMPKTEGGPIFSDVVLSRLVQRGFRVIDPGAVRGLSLTLGRNPRGGIDHELMAALYDTLGVTTIITGVVESFRPSRVSTELSFPRIRISGRLIDTRSGRLRTSAQVTRSGDREHILGFGRTRSTTKVVQAAASAFLDRLSLQKENSSDHQ